MLRSCARARQYRQIQTLNGIQYRIFTAKIQQTLAPVDETLAPKTDTYIDPESDETELTYKQYIKLYKTVSKFNLSLLNGVVTGSTALICSGGILFGVTIPSTIGCISLAISASSLNQLQERQYDKLMLRTKLIRPLCTGKLTPNDVKIWSLLSLIIGTSTLTLYCGTTATIIGISTLFMYNLIYTPLKRITPYNTEFGAIVGALPPQIGIAASHYNSNINPSFLNVLSDTIHDPLCWYSFILLYTWQMPHFLYLSIRNKNDYIRGGFKMWSGEYEGDSLCKKKSLLYTSALIPLPMLLAYSDVTSWMFACDGTVLNTLYWMSVYKWYKSKGDKDGKRSFYFNLLYLPSILFLMILHSKRWKYSKGDFFAIHLAWLQDKGIQHCLYEHEYEDSGLPDDIVTCTSPFRY
eukprot:322294_1